MRRARTEDNLASIPSNALVELFQDQKNADDPVREQYAPASLFGTAAALAAGDAASAAALVALEAGGTVAAVTATVDGLTTGLIPATASVVEVTSDTATKQISLPAAVDGKKLRIHVAATGCELISAVAADKVNNVVVGATNEAALVAGTTYELRYVLSAQNWVMTGLTALGAVETPVIPDAL